MGAVENAGPLTLRRRNETLALGLVAVMDVAGDDILGVHDTPVGQQCASLHQRGVCLIARTDDVGAFALAEPLVQLRFGADDLLAVVGLIDRVRVAVENGADLLSRERTDAAPGESGVYSAVRRESKFFPDPVELVRRHAILRERTDECVLDRERFGMGYGHLVQPGHTDMVVDLAKRMVGRKAHFAGIVFAGRNLLKLTDCQIDVCEIDCHL